MRGESGEVEERRRMTDAGAIDEARKADSLAAARVREEGVAAEEGSKAGVVVRRYSRAAF